MASRNKRKKDWIDAYKDVQQGIARKPPGDDWKTFIQLKEELKLGNCKTRQIIKDLNDAGKLEVMSGSEPDVTGVLKKRVWYRLKE